MSYSEITAGVWEVRWRQGGKNRSKRVYSKEAALALETAKQQAKRRPATAAVEIPRQTFIELARDVWDRRYAKKAPKTRDGYAWLLDTHIAPGLGGYLLEELTPDALEEWVADMTRRGVGVEAIRKSVMLTRGILQRAVEWRRLPMNPAAHLELPEPAERQEIRPLSPEDIWRLILAFRAVGDFEGALLVALMGFAGLRVEEALGLPWGNVRERTLLIEQVVSAGEIRGRTKGSRQSRAVDLLPPLAADLAKYRLLSGRPNPTALVFACEDGSCWTPGRFNNWRGRKFARVVTPIVCSVCGRSGRKAGAKCVAKTCNGEYVETGIGAERVAAGLPKPTPYYLRHSFASLLLHEGRPAIYVSRQLGHSMAILDRTYAHLIAELAGTEQCSAAQALNEGRERALAA